MEDALRGREIALNQVPVVLSGAARRIRLVRPKGTDINIDAWGKALVALVIASWGASFVAGFQVCLAALTLAGYAASIYGLFKPPVGLLGIGVLCTVDAVTRSFLLTGGMFRWNTFNYWLVLVALLNIALLFRLRYLPLRILFVLAFVLGIGLVYSPDMENGTQHVLALSACFGLLVYFAKNELSPALWQWFGVVNGIIGGIGGLMFLLVAGAQSLNPNVYVFFPLTAMFSICLALRYLDRRPGIQLALLGLAVLNFAWVFISTSRSGVLVGICCILFLVLQIRRFSHFATIVIVAVLVGSAVLSQFTEMGEYTISRFSKLSESDRSLANRTSGRSDLLEGGWEVFLDNPTMGVGTGGFSARWARVSAEMNLTYQYGGRADAHAGWIKVLSENGILGFVPMTLFVLSFTFMGWKRRRLQVLPMGLFVTTILSISFFMTEFQSKGLWLLATGCMVILSRGYSTQAALRGDPAKRHTSMFGSRS